MVGWKLPIYLYHSITTIFGFWLDIILYEAIMWWRRGELAYYYLLPIIVTYILAGIISDYHYTHNIKGEWDRMYSLLSNKTKEHFSSQYNILFAISGICLGCSSLAIYMDKSFVVYSSTIVANVFELVSSFEKDRVIWRITIGNRIDADGAYRVCAFVLPAANKRPYGDDNALEIRYFLCDGLRKRDIKRNSVRILLERFPGYISILDVTD